MADDIQIFRTLATSLVNAVLKLSKTAQTGLASFIEKPVFPQGFPPGDEKYKLADGSGMLLATLESIQSIRHSTS